MPLDFPDSPTIGQIFPNADTAWIWDGVKWEGAYPGEIYLKLTGGTLSGPLYIATPAIPVQSTTAAGFGSKRWGLAINTGDDGPAGTIESVGEPATNGARPHDGDR